MNFKKILKIVTIFTAFLLIVFASVKCTQYITKMHYEKTYKLHLREITDGPAVTEFKVKSNKKSTNIFNAGFYVTVDISGTVPDKNTYVKYIHKSEHYENIDERTVLVVDFEPVYGYSKIPVNFDKKFSKHFKCHYTTKQFGKLKYTFRCGGLEKNIYISYNE